MLFSCEVLAVPLLTKSGQHGCVAFGAELELTSRSIALSLCLPFGGYKQLRYWARMRRIGEVFSSIMNKLTLVPSQLYQCQGMMFYRVNLHSLAHCQRHLPTAARPEPVS